MSLKHVFVKLIGMISLEIREQNSTNKHDFTPPPRPIDVCSIKLAFLYYSGVRVSLNNFKFSNSFSFFFSELRNTEIFGGNCSRLYLSESIFVKYTPSRGCLENDDLDTPLQLRYLIRANFALNFLVMKSSTFDLVRLIKSSTFGL